MQPKEFEKKNLTHIISEIPYEIIKPIIEGDNLYSKEEIIEQKEQKKGRTPFYILENAEEDYRKIQEKYGKLTRTKLAKVAPGFYINSLGWEKEGKINFLPPKSSKKGIK